jgi:hypothetical protein
VSIDKPNICPRDNGRAFDLEFSHAGSAWLCHVNRELLDDEVGSASSQSDREAYLHEHLEQIMQACRAKIEGGYAPEPFASGVHCVPAR